MTNRRVMVRLLAALYAVPWLAEASADSTTEAQAAGKAWLSMLDAVDYAGTWSSAASSFKSAIAAHAWQQAAQAARQPLGVVKARQQKSATSTRSLPGAPDGQYVVFLFDTNFENKAHGTETMTLAQDQDGQWRVAGYFVK